MINKLLVCIDVDLHYGIVLFLHDVTSQFYIKCGVAIQYKVLKVSEMAGNLAPCRFLIIIYINI